MYYISENKQDLEDYNQKVIEGEKYDGTTTTDWATIIEHQNGNLFAILKHDNYHSPLQSVSDLDDWFDDNIL